ncbi:hypothetical protein IX318_000850 [Porphyromonas levii]|nr:hypothetical protein [Porphyromonas levii]MBR8714997.1 hypothetical protein [Porphyromonas levii]MBR8727463.1 hypothetical protein [Porphyromonas levii]MBR8730942.1 hypothetical protein [Porphyromonas levii]MBR8735817.1 hypothetical protein [Porphyromonas levii]
MPMGKRLFTSTIEVYGLNIVGFFQGVSTILLDLMCTN